MRGTKGKHWKWSDEAKQRHSNIFKGYIWYTNGKENIQLIIGEEIPEGFYPGLTKSESSKEKSKSHLIDYSKKRKGKHWTKKGYFRKWEK